MRRFLLGSIVPVLFLGVWEISSRTGLLTLESLSRPSDILIAGVHSLLDGSLLLATFQTFEAALLGLAIAAAIGIICGTVLGLSPMTERVTGPTIEALRPIPAIAFMPLALMMFGFGVTLEASIVAYACIWPILIVTVAAVRAIEPRLLDVADVLQLPFWKQMLTIILPAAFARINVGLRVAAAISLVVAVTVEIVLNPRGLGYRLILASQEIKIGLMYAQLVWLCVVGYLLNAILRNVGTGSIALWSSAR
jgi:ABC-type nitrate/sulfonate/bicarbonate transport system permease component